jgi:hypothetical protein
MTPNNGASMSAFKIKLPQASLAAPLETRQATTKTITLRGALT